MIDTEGEWLTSLPNDKKIRFLSSLSCAITIAGRNSYEAGTADLTNPRQLRRVNEIQHRVTSCLREALTGRNVPAFERSIASWVLDSPDEDLSPHLHWCWVEAKKAIGIESAIGPTIT